MRDRFPVSAVVAVLLVGLGAGCEELAEAPGRSLTDVEAARLAEHLLGKAGIRKGLCSVLGAADGKLALQIVRKSDFLVDVREARAEAVAAAQRTVDVEGLWVKRIIVAKGPLDRLGYADGTIDLVAAAELKSSDLAGLKPSEIVRVLRPRGKAVLGCRNGLKDAVTIDRLKQHFGSRAKVSKDRFGVWAEMVKSVPEGVDSWSHWEKGPENNPVSTDSTVRPPYLIQWLDRPYFVAMPVVTTAAGGRTFLALGNITHHPREWATLYTLIARNGYNGRVLWQRKLPEGYMVHRSAFVAAEDVFTLIDGDRALELDAETGRELGEIRIPGLREEWKWMARVADRLFVLSGKDYRMQTVRSRNWGAGWWWTGMSRGYKAERVPWCWGTTITAIDLKTRKVLWTHKEENPIDARAMVAGGGKVFFYSPNSRVGCLDGATGSLSWTNTDPEISKLIEQPGQGLQGHPGFRSTCAGLYTPNAVLFQVQNRMNVTALSTKDGTLLWHRKKTIQRPNLIYVDGQVIGALGSWGNHLALDPVTGKTLTDLKFAKYGCVRLTANPNALFTRGEGVLRYDRKSRKVERLTAVRPGCNDGVITANGLLYVGPWFCDCNLSLIGTAALCSAGDLPVRRADAGRLETGPGKSENVEPLPVTPGDWPTYRASNRRSASSAAAVPTATTMLWHVHPEAPTLPTPPTAVGEFVFLAGDDGKVRAVDAESGKTRWSHPTGGPIRIGPTIWQGRAYVGSADGWVYALEARTGRLLWRFRAAPAERRIMVYGALSSTWPVNSGVLVHDGTAYAAAGLADFCGTHVCALDAVTGKRQWQNSDTGPLDGKLGNGVSVQGNLTAADGRLLLAGGNQISPAAYELGSGKFTPPRKVTLKPGANRGQEVAVFRDRCLLFGGRLMYSPTEQVTSSAYFTVRKDQKEFRLLTGRVPPAWNDRTFLCVHGRGGPVCYDADRVEELIRKGFPPLPPGKKSYGRRCLIQDLPKGSARWAVSGRRATISLALAKNAALVVDESYPARTPSTCNLSALALTDGRALWRYQLPSRALPGGLLVDRRGRVVVALEDGGLVCYGSKP